MSGLRGVGVRIDGQLAPWWYGGPCRCGRMVLTAANEGTCLICGTGAARPLVNANLKFRSRRLPRDLGPVMRAPAFPLCFDNVIPRGHVDIMFERTT